MSDCVCGIDKQIGKNHVCTLMVWVHAIQRLMETVLRVTNTDLPVDGKLVEGFQLLAHLFQEHIAGSGKHAL